jgi:hypothetical protein
MSRIVSQRRDARESTIEFSAASAAPLREQRFRSQRRLGLEDGRGINLLISSLAVLAPSARDILILPSNASYVDEAPVL